MANKKTNLVTPKWLAKIDPMLATRPVKMALKKGETESFVETFSVLQLPQRFNHKY